MFHVEHRQNKQEKTSKIREGFRNAMEVPVGESNASNTLPEPPAADGSTAAAAPKRRRGRPAKHMVQLEPEPSQNGSSGTTAVAGGGRLQASVRQGLEAFIGR